MRISPQVTHGRDVEPFLFSVRETLSLRHGNVAAIRELRNDDGEIYLVMEHLEGESAATLVHRLDVEGRVLDFGLAAHVIAEVSAALDAAHELGILHEHLTPHDVFIGYDGSVKVLDIGLARALDELTRATGIRERDLPYASPERCKGDPLDRRSDVFSLGAILWELMTGVSPFERMTQADTLRAILTAEPELPSTKILRSFPTELSRIALRALSRDPTTRYATARALGDDLRAFVGSVPMGGASPSTPLATLMQSQFAKRIKNNTRMLRRLDAGPSSKAPVAIDTAPESSRSVPDAAELERPTVEAFQPMAIEARPPAGGPSAPAPPEPAASDADAAAEAAELPLALPRADRRRSVAGFTALGLALLLGLVAFVLAKRSPSEPPVAAATQPSAPPLAAPPAAEPQANASPLPSASAPQQEATATIHIETTPTRATIVVAGLTKGVSPLDLTLPRSKEPVTVEVRHPGHQIARETIVPDADQRFKLNLAVLPAPVQRPTPPAAVPSASSPYHRFE